MTWEDRQKEAAYTSPSGTRFAFLFEDTSKIFGNRTSAFEFPNVDGALIQHLGNIGRRYPLKIFFSGPDYDLETDEFEKALSEKGIGVLETPLYGVVNVVPFGQITRRDNLKTAANQSIVEVTFWETKGIIFPTVIANPLSQVQNGIAEYNIAAAETLEENTVLDKQLERQTFEDGYLALADRTKTKLDPIANVQNDVRQQFNTIDRSINNGIDALVKDPLTLGFQTVALVQSPARARANITAKLASYRSLVDDIVAGTGSLNLSSNDFHTSDLFASSYVTGSVLSSINNEFDTKPGALSAAEEILDQFSLVVAWRDANFDNLGQNDTGESYQKLLDTVSIAAGFLVELSFSLKQERKLTLTSARTMVDLVGELYGSVDDQLDFFIDSNELSGSEMLELPAGREIVYYV